jgi:hypothetical protein
MMKVQIEIPDHLMRAAEAEGARRGRSAAEQIGVWLRIGRALERSNAFDHERVDAAMNSALSRDELTALEQHVYDGEVDAFFESPMEEACLQKLLAAGGPLVGAEDEETTVEELLVVVQR